MNYNENLNDIQNELLESMPSTYSKIKGCWLWEMMKAFAIKLSELLSLLTSTADKLSIENLQGDELDAYVKQWTDLTRKTAAKAEGIITVTGNGNIYAGTVVATESGMQFIVKEDTLVDGTEEVEIEAVEAGDRGNVEANSIKVLVTSNAYVSSINNANATTGGADEETDEALRTRYYLRLQMPATSGNKSHYILWALECTGVGGAKATRDASINNKVNLYICGNNGEAVDESVINDVQDYIDPNINGDGSGTAPVGAICQVYSATEKAIAISGTVELDNTIEGDVVIENIKAAINEYLSGINFNATELSYAKLLNIAIGCDGVNDIEYFRLNNGYVNITCTETEIFKIGSFNMEVK